jgi:hypothetical protein
MEALTRLQVAEVQTIVDISKYQCNTCGYVYDPVVGDSSNAVLLGTPFSELPDG